VHVCCGKRMMKREENDEDDATVGQTIRRHFRAPPLPLLLHRGN